MLAEFSGSKVLTVALFLCAFTVPCKAQHSLDAVHKPAAEILRKVVRYEQHYLGSQPYYHTYVRYGQLVGHRDWSRYIKSLAYVEGSTVRTAPEAVRKAFWLNTYNMMVIDAIAQNYPFKEGLATGDYPANSLRGNAQAWRKPLYVAGSTYSLQALENLLLEFDDFRVPLAMCDGAVSSPALPRDLYRSGVVDSQLDDAVANFCLDPTNVWLDRTKNTLQISAIFRRYSDAFRNVSTSPLPLAYQGSPVELRQGLGVVWPHLPVDAQNCIPARKSRLQFQAFKWGLNDLVD